MEWYPSHPNSCIVCKFEHVSSSASDHMLMFNCKVCRGPSVKYYKLGLGNAGLVSVGGCGSLGFSDGGHVLLRRLPSSAT